MIPSGYLQALTELSLSVAFAFLVLCLFARVLMYLIDKTERNFPRYISRRKGK